MRYTAVFEFNEAPHVKKSDSWLGGTLCVVNFSDGLAELALLKNKMEAIEYWYNTDGSVDDLFQIMELTYNAHTYDTIEHKNEQHEGVSVDIDVRPCPFCGSTNGTDEQGETYRWRLWRCNECGACGPETRCDIKDSMNEARKLAIEAWNQHSIWRPIETAPDGVSFYAADPDNRYYLGSLVDGKFINTKGEVPCVAPTHWMPLPPPPLA